MSIDDQPLRDTLNTLARLFVGTASLDNTLRTVSELATHALPQTELAGITMLVDGHPRTAVFSDNEAPDIDASQYGSGEGPCLQAFRTKQVIIIDSTETDRRFPSFCQVAREHGIQSTLSLPLVAGDDGIGALNLYSRAAAAFSHDDAVTGERFALHASVVLANSQAYWGSRLLSEHLSEAMVSRATIEQAKGILMSQSAVTPETAFEMLRDASQRENRKIREIAQELVDRAITRRSGK